MIKAYLLSAWHLYICITHKSINSNHRISEGRPSHRTDWAFSLKHVDRIRSSGSELYMEFWCKNRIETTKFYDLNIYLEWIGSVTKFFVKILLLKRTDLHESTYSLHKYIVNIKFRYSYFVNSFIFENVFFIFLKLKIQNILS